MYTGCNWCDLDSGYTTLLDADGRPVRAYVSLTRDGSVWVRLGRDQNSLDWNYEDEDKFRFQVSVLDADSISLLRHLNYTDYCVLTDVDMKV